MLTVRTILGAGWLVSSRLLGRSIDFVTLLVLARALSPADFGLTSLAMTLIAVIDIVLEIPLSQALVRLHTLDRPSIDTAFTLGLIRSGALALLLMCAAWPFAVFYHDGRLTGLIMLLSIGPIARGLYNPNMATHIKDLHFRPVVFAEVVGKLASLIAGLFVLHLGGGYWAIVANSIVGPIVATGLSYALAPYRPALSLAARRYFINFVGWYSCAQFVSAINWQLDKVLLGQFLPKARLGQYVMAGDVAVLPTQSLIGPAMQPVMAAFATMNADEDRLRSAFLKATSYAMMIAAPACVGMCLTADLIIGLLLGDQWHAAAGYLRWIALTIAPVAYFQALYSLCIALGRPMVIFRLNTIEFALRIVAVPIGFYGLEIEGVIAARGLVAVLMFVMSVRSARSLIGLGVGRQLHNIWKIGVACLVMVIAVLIVRELITAAHIIPIARLILTAGAGAAVYAATLLALGVRPPFALPKRRPTASRGFAKLGRR